MRDGGLAAVPPPRRVDGATPRHGEEPAFGIVGNAALVGQSESAAAKASASASSAPATSPLRAARKATSLP